MNVFAKLANVKRLLKGCPLESQEELHGCLMRLSKWHYAKDKKKIKLTEKDSAVYELLITNGYNPSTVYRWFLLEKSPLEIRQKIITRQISQRQASKEKKIVNSLASTTQQDLINEIMDCVNRYIVR